MLAARPPPANLRERRFPRDEMTEPAAALRRLRRLHEATRSRPPPAAAAGPAPAAAEAPIALRPEPRRPLGVGDLMLGCTFQRLGLLLAASLIAFMFTIRRKIARGKICLPRASMQWLHKIRKRSHDGRAAMRN